VSPLYILLAEDTYQKEKKESRKPEIHREMVKYSQISKLDLQFWTIGQSGQEGETSSIFYLEGSFFIFS
jgi:hypothetical protein